jgi:hypothetical protein
VNGAHGQSTNPRLSLVAVELDGEAASRRSVRMKHGDPQLDSQHGNGRRHARREDPETLNAISAVAQRKHGGRTNRSLKVRTAVLEYAERELRLEAEEKERAVST